MPDPDSNPASFNFRSSWQLQVGLETAWEALIDFETWPEWWPGLMAVVETSRGDSEGIGQRADSRWRAPLGYRIGFEIETVGREYLKSLSGRASGDLSGSGVWRISPVRDPERSRDARTRIAFEWNVVATGRWMRILNRIARPVLVMSHDHVMKRGASGLAEYLECELSEFTTAERG